MDTKNESDQRSPMAQAAQWTSHVTTISLEMVLPGLGGHWLDRRLGTGMVFLVLGALFGLTAGMWHLLKLTATTDKPAKRRPRTPDADSPRPPHV